MAEGDYGWFAFNPRGDLPSALPAAEREDMSGSKPGSSEAAAAALLLPQMPLRNSHHFWRLAPPEGAFLSLCRHGFGCPGWPGQPVGTGQPCPVLTRHLPFPSWESHTR